MVATKLKNELIDQLYEIGAISFPDSNVPLTPPYEINLQLLNSNPKILKFAGRLFEGFIKNGEFDRIVSPHSDIPLGTTIALEFNIPMLFVRKERKVYGMGRLIEGGFKQGEKVIVINDEISDPAESLQLFGRLEGSGLNVREIWVLFDREVGTMEILKNKKYFCRAIFTLNDIFIRLSQKNLIPESKMSRLKKYLEEQKSEFLIKYSPTKTRGKLKS